MNILHVYRTYYPDPPGGLQEAIRQICLSTQAFGANNTIFTLSPDPSPQMMERQEAQVVRSKSWCAPASCDIGGPDAFMRFHKLASQADVIHYLFPWPFGDVLHAMAPKKPSVLTYISDIVRQKWLGAAYAPLMMRTLHSMDAIVTNAPSYASSSPILSQPAFQPVLHHIPLGIVESSYPDTSDDTILPRIGLQEGEPFVLFIGVLRYYKGLHTLVDACKKLPYKVVIAGSGPEGAALRAQATSLGLTNLIFAGQVSEAEKRALLQSCSMLVLPSHLRSEAYGMVLVEASMFGKPMVSCEINTGTSYVNLDNETGLVVPPENPEAFAQAINTIMADTALRTTLGAAARKRYETHFSGHVLGKGYSDLFRSTHEQFQARR